MPAGNTHYVHWMAEVHSGSFAPNFTLLNGKELQQSDKWTKVLWLYLML